jgi:acyl transferase domain-containing protein/phosphopantetheinyl transferase
VYWSLDLGEKENWRGVFDKVGVLGSAPSRAHTDRTSRGHATDEDRDIAIVGMSIFCPAGESIEEFWQGISTGGDFISEAPPDVLDPFHFEGDSNDIDRFYCNRGGFAKAFKVDPLRYGILPITADGVDPDQLMSMAGVEQALLDAGIFAKEISLNKCSIIIGKGNFSGLIALRCTEIIRNALQFTKLLKVALPDLTETDLDKVRKAYQREQGRFQADMAIGTMPNLVASLVANRFDMHGPAYSIDAACASGVVAINHSIALLRSGECEVAVAGGMHTAQSAMFWSAFDMMGAMSRRQQIAPFSKDADGLLIGQGGGFIVLKTLRRALEDGDRIYAVIKDTAVSSDGAGTHATVTSVKGQVRVLKKAWEAAGMDPAIIGHIEAHGTATPVGDRTEIATLKEFFGDNTHPRAFVGSVKSNIGHAMPAAGMMGIIKTALALYHRTIPPTLHCEEPLAGMFESRFLPPQEAIPWDGDEYPLVAGVNAFGFGGINSHAILTAYEPAPGAPPQPKPTPYRGEALLVSARDKESLIEKLKTSDCTHTGGDYRIVIFDPNEARIKQAVAIVEKDVPWRGRLDIWFSNRPLLTEGGKVVYIVPGLGAEQVAETDSLSDALDLPRMEAFLDGACGDNEAYRGFLADFFTGTLCKGGLAKLGVQADIYIGHSMGEWFATAHADMLEGSWDQFFKHLHDSDVSGEYPLLAVSGADVQTLESWCAEIGDIYVACDNCPSQMLVCGKPSAVEALQKRLDAKHLFYTTLAYGQGYHTPLVRGAVASPGEMMSSYDIKQGIAPVWSATTLEQVSTDEDEYRDLVESQLTRPVYFRGLIEKLYDEQDARVFVQIGLGALTNFVEDTLKGKEFSVVASVVPGRDGTDQLRRVLAALFVEGQEVDRDFLGVKHIYQVEHNLMIIQGGAPLLLTDLPELREVVRERYGSSGLRLGLNATADAAPDTTAHPLVRAANENMREALKTQNELLDLFEQNGLTAQTAAGSATATSTFSTAVPVPESALGAAPEARPATAPVAQQTFATPRQEDFEETLRLTFEDHPYLIDHCIIRQPEGWEYQEDLVPVSPLTMTIELLSEIALKHASGRKLLTVSKVAAHRWVEVTQPFEGLVKGSWKAPDTLTLSLEGFAQAEFSFGEAWPEPPADYAGAIDIGAEIAKPLTAAEYYDRYAFHGPQYHSNTEMLKVGARGMLNTAVKQTGKGSLLDIMGQQLGLFLHLTQTENTISFPIRLKELSFYGDIFDQGGVFEHTLIITRLTEGVIAGDMVFKRDGKIWCVARDFVCQRFQNELPVWSVCLKPQFYVLAKEIAPGVFHCSGAYRGNVLLLLEKRYINHWDRAELGSDVSQERWREYLISRIALKDAVRSRIALPDGTMPYPIEISCQHDENGKPSIVGHGPTAGMVEDICVSLSHKDAEAVAIAADAPVGIDIEKIEGKDEDFLKAVFTEGERVLLGDQPQPEAVIRFWVAKEACAKKTGEGLITSPKRFEVGAIDGDVLVVGDERVQTRKLGDGYLIGWTL